MNSTLISYTDNDTVGSFMTQATLHRKGVVLGRELETVYIVLKNKLLHFLCLQIDLANTIVIIVVRVTS